MEEQKVSKEEVFTIAQSFLSPDMCDFYVYKASKIYLLTDVERKMFMRIKTMEAKRKYMSDFFMNLYNILCKQGETQELPVTPATTSKKAQIRHLSLVK